MEKELFVLLVDDDEDEYILLKSMFSRLPGQSQGKRYILDWAATYEAGLSACAQKSYDISLVDYHLGRYNGLDLMRAAAAQGCQAPFILLTGQGSYELDLAAMQQGVYDYLLKDQINEFTLERTIRYALGRRQIEEDLERRVRARTQELQSEIDRRTLAEAELREREAKLIESESRFRALAETTSAAIFIVQEGLIRYANPAARFVTGYTPDELVGSQLWKLAHPAYQAALRETRLETRWSSAIPARYEIKIYNKQGDERWLDISAGNMQYSGQPAWVFTAFDITERDRAEQALRRTRDELEQRVAVRTAELSARNAEIQTASQRLQTVLSTLPVGIVIASEDGVILEANTAFRDLWEVTGPLPADINQWDLLRGWQPGNGRAAALSEWLFDRAIKQGQTVLGEMLDIETEGGRQKTILFSVVPIIDPHGQTAGGVAVIQDISDQRQLEQAAQTAAREAQQRADELEGLHRATAALLSTLDMDELLCQILDAAQSAIPAAEKGMLHLVSPTTGQLQMRATLGFSDERIRVIHSPKEAGYPARVIRYRQPMLVNDTLADGLPQELSALPPQISGMRSMILAPLRIGDQVLGTLSLSATRPGVFSESNLRLLASFAATTTAALQNAILHAEIKQLAVTDPLTGQFNRRAFFELGQRELERFLRFNHPLTAVMIDLDHFKLINDTYGHAIGDQILRTLTDRCRGSIRETDIFGRYGGDEFALLLPDTDMVTANIIANRIREAVSNTPWVTEQGLVTVTASLGAAGAGKHHRALAEVLADADRALYKAKDEGRNRVAVFEG